MVVRLRLNVYKQWLSLMIITNSTLIASSNVARNCWSKIRRYHDSIFVTKLLCDLHKVSNKHKDKVQKQANQIKQCLIQAKEYYDASQGVTLATKPVLLYYSVMSLALAEILFKHDGVSSLDKARSKNAHHGLVFKFGQSANSPSSYFLAEQASQLRAVPMLIGTERQGTFELWHQSSREPPVCGRREVVYPTGYSTITPCSPILSSDDTPFSPIPSSGVSLLDCMVELPTMYNFIYENGLFSRVVRGGVQSRMVVSSSLETLDITMHPAHSSVLDEIYSKFLVKPNDIQHFKVLEMDRGIQITIELGLENVPRFHSPQATTINEKEVFFSSGQLKLNEFGLFYVALYIAGNYARYYPDKWLPNIDSASPIALAIEELVFHAVERVPLLALNELSQTYHVLS